MIQPSVILSLQPKQVLIEEYTKPNFYAPKYGSPDVTEISSDLNTLNAPGLT